jgi:hypothetical protein
MAMEIHCKDEKPQQLCAVQAMMVTFTKKHLRGNNEKTSKKQKVLGVKHEKKLNHEKTQEEKGDNIFGKLSKLYKGLLWILTTNLNKHNNNVNKKHKEKCLDWCS